MAAMKLLGVSVGRPREIVYRDRRGREKTTTTSIFKDPVAGRVMLRTLDIDGDSSRTSTATAGPTGRPMSIRSRTTGTGPTSSGATISRCFPSSAKT